MKTFRLSRKSYAIAAAIGVVGTCAGLYTHHRLASHTPVPLSVRSVAGKWKGIALEPTVLSSTRHTVRTPIAITFGPDGRGITRTGPRMVADTRLDYAVHGESLILRNVYDIRGNRVLHDPAFELHASLTGETLTLSGSGKPTLVLYRD